MYNYNPYGQPVPDMLAQYRAPYMPQQMQPQQMQMPPQQMPPPQQNQGGNGLIWVQGEAGAKSYLVAPGTTLMLMDSEAQTFYIKQADASGMPMPLRIFDYTERTAQPAQPAQAAQTAPFDPTRYITREEFDRRLDELTAPHREEE